MASLRGDRKSFKRPPAQYRPWLHWLWNDRLDPASIRQQHDRFVMDGLGGLLVHAYPGLPSDEFLNAGWFAGVEEVLRRGRKRGSSIVLVDDYAWPSGSGDGQWLMEREDCQAYRLVLDDRPARSDESVLPGEALAAFVVTRSDAGGGIHRRAGGGISLTPDEIRCVPVIMDVAEEFLSGSRLLTFRVERRVGQLNLLDTRAVESFIERSHLPYTSACKRYFGSSLSQFYSYGVQLDPAASELPWDPELPNLFRDTRGYDLMPHLPALFFETPDCERVRYHFWTLVAEMFREGYPATVGRWRRENHVRDGGHFAFSPTLKDCTRNVGSIMPLYALQDFPAVHLPGIAYFRQENRAEYVQCVVALKQAASIRDQFEKEGLAVEAFAGTGHGLRLEEMQGAAMFQLALGATHTIHDAGAIATRGDRKIESAPILGPQQPYWRHAAAHFDGLARAAWLLSQGQRVCDVLVLHPAASVHAAYRHFRNDEEAKHGGYVFDADLPFEIIDKHTALLTSALLDHQIDFHFGDEELLARSATVEHKQITVGVHPYRIVVIPPSLNLRASTVDILQDFATGGGKVIMVGSTPRMVDGYSSSSLSSFVEEYVLRVVDGIDHYDYSFLIDALDKLDARVARLDTDEGESLRGLTVHRRTWGDRDIVFAVNNRAEALRARLHFDLTFAGRVEEWHLDTGEVEVLHACVPGESFALPVDWAPGQARAFVCIPREVKFDAPRIVDGSRVVEADWAGRRTEPNFLLLTACRFSEEGTLRSVSDARRYLFKQSRKLRAPARVTARWPFQVSPIIPWTEACHALLEVADELEIWLNGETLEVDGAQAVEGGFVRVELPQLRLGENELMVRGIYPDPWSFEAPRIAGEFHVNSADNIAFVIEFETGPIDVGPWCERGMPFYAGGVVYRAEFEEISLAPDERIVVELRGLCGTAQVRVNGAEAGTIIAAPYVCDLSEHWKAAHTLVEVEVHNTLRNLIGPHFPKDEHLQYYDRDSYEGSVSEALSFVREGLFESPIVRIDSMVHASAAE